MNNTLFPCHRTFFAINTVHLKYRQYDPLQMVEDSNILAAPVGENTKHEIHI